MRCLQDELVKVRLEHAENEATIRELGDRCQKLDKVRIVVGRGDLEEWEGHGILVHRVTELNILKGVKNDERRLKLV